MVFDRGHQMMVVALWLNGADNSVTLGADSVLSLAGATHVVTAGLGDSLAIRGGSGDLIRAGRNDILSDLGSQTQFDIGGAIGALQIHHFGADASAVIDLLNGVGAYATAAQAFAHLRSNGAGGERLSLGTSGYIDFVATTNLTVNSFKIGGGSDLRRWVSA